MLTKEPEMLQPDAFCEHTMQQNATAAEASPRTPLEELTALSRPLAGFKGAAWRQGGEGNRRGRESRGRERQEKGREGGEEEGEERGGEVDSDAQLEQDRRLAKAGPGCATYGCGGAQYLRVLSGHCQ